MKATKSNQIVTQTMTVRGELLKTVTLYADGRLVLALDVIQGVRHD